MIVDLNVKGKIVAVVGGGKEAVRKIQALLTQDCEIVVIAAEASKELRRWAEEGKILLKRQRIENGECLRDLEGLFIMIAATNDFALNRALVEEARKLRCYAYSADDPEYSDFSHPAVINIDDTVEIAVSTGGRSPLMAGKLRERAEQVFRQLITKEDILQIRLQDKLRKVARNKIEGSEARRKFLTGILNNRKIKQLLVMGKAEEAEKIALKELENG